jgi:hypothetical protein
VPALRRLPSPGGPNSGRASRQQLSDRTKKELDIKRIKSEYYLRLTDPKESPSLRGERAHLGSQKSLGGLPFCCVCQGPAGADLCNRVARERGHYRWHVSKPYLPLILRVEAQLVSARFDYDTELVGREEIDDKRLIGLPRGGQDQSCRVARLCVAEPRWFCSS